MIRPDIGGKMTLLYSDRHRPRICVCCRYTPEQHEDIICICFSAEAQFLDTGGNQLQNTLCCIVVQFSLGYWQQQWKRNIAIPPFSNPAGMFWIVFSTQIVGDDIDTTVTILTGKGKMIPHRKLVGLAINNWICNIYRLTKQRLVKYWNYIIDIEAIPTGHIIGSNRYDGDTVVTCHLIMPVTAVQTPRFQPVTILPPAGGTGPDILWRNSIG